jgi:hypothetical protein
MLHDFRQTKQTDERNGLKFCVTVLHFLVFFSILHSNLIRAYFTSDVRIHILFEYTL